jgi:hypothetical protein
MAKNKIVISDADRINNMLESDHRKIKKKIQYEMLPLNPTRLFEIDERVQFGHHNEVYIREIYENGLYYKIESIGVKRDRDKPAANEFHLVEWYELYKYDQNKLTCFAQEEKFRITYSNSSIDSLLHMIYHAGVDFDVEYQRDYVWNMQDKLDLIDSIFNNVNIGAFVFVQRDFGIEKKLYEVLDGKQRLTAIKEFYEDRFPFNGIYFSELSFHDKLKFEHHGIMYGYLSNPDMKSVYEAFISLNTKGRQMKKEDIDKVKELLKSIV